MLTMDLPASVYDIDRDWLRAAIRAGGHDVEVVSAERIDVIHSTCTKARFELTYDRDIGLPSRMILKGAFEDHSERMKEMYQGEALFYRQMAGRLKTFLARSLRELVGQPRQDLVAARYEKFRRMGKWLDVPA